MTEPLDKGLATSPSAPSYPRAAPRSAGEAIKPMIAPAPPVKKKRRRGGLVASLSAALSILMFGLLTVVGSVVFVQRQLDEEGPLTADKIVVINKGDSIEDISETLRRENVITYPYVMMGSVYLRGLRVKAGEYQFKARANLSSVIDTLVEGKAILHGITIPEGLTSEQIVGRLKESDILTGDVRDIPKEGSLLPDTYKFQRNTSREQALVTMAQAHKKALADVWAKRSPEMPLKSQQELVTLASIVEKETGKADERTRVAGVFINRLQKRMRLQSDPTIVYGIVGGKGTLGRGILKTEIQTPTPYNTYTIDGLPPTPIANPGKAALEAVANPSRTRDLFFVADGTGGHVFAETYDQHLRNVSKWRQVEAGRRERSNAADRSDSSDIASEPLTSSARESVVTPPIAQQVVPVLPRVDQNTAPITAIQPSGAAPRKELGNTTQQTERETTQSVKPVPMLPLGGASNNSAETIQTPNIPREPNRSPASRTAAEAVEGTNKDPLLNKNYDLNSPKSVPVLRP